MRNLCYKIGRTVGYYGEKIRQLRIKFAFTRAHRNTGLSGYFRRGPFGGDE